MYRSILLEDRDATLIQLDEWVDLAFTEVSRHLTEGNPEGARVLKVLNGTLLEVDLHANDVAYANQITGSHIFLKLFLV